ncbi:hypothetical protein AZI87_07740 [Bdellovibrio bacteriovorus]|uniref:DUF4430 domain-containing protein n=1 Tax=Bdellovibrio bacteriovorus TaxID=959 RepID=A0A161PF71_BDEBC|nr:hypothetical protein [Bdellovibrio bacteriovorus]KYG69104.1 hypothetical protein AZI87_07740 [Bdellovibrio bacteriovorus]
MKKTLFALILSASSYSQAITWEVYGPCDDKPVHHGKVDVDLNKSVGDITVAIFDANKIPYIGGPEGMNSIINTPTGLDSLEIVSNSEMRAYGWCYAINGSTPYKMPNVLNLKSQDDRLVWYYGYTTNKENVWQDDMCTPAFWVRSEQFCPKKK